MNSASLGVRHASGLRGHLHVAERSRLLQAAGLMGLGLSRALETSAPLSLQDSSPKDTAPWFPLPLGEFFLDYLPHSTGDTTGSPSVTESCPPHFLEFSDCSVPTSNLPVKILSSCKPSAWPPHSCQSTSCTSGAIILVPSNRHFLPGQLQ